MNAIEINEDFQNEVMEVLSKNMPEYVCGVVKERLDKADELEETVSAQSKTLDKTHEELKELRALKLSAAEVEHDRGVNHDDLVQLNAAKVEFERDKKVFELKTQLAAQETISGNTMKIMESLTRNTEYRKHVHGSKPVAVDGGGTGCGYVSQNEQHSESTTEGAD